MGTPERVVIGEAELWLGDCREILPTLEPVDACVTDPPYEAEAHTLTRRTRGYLEGRAPYPSIDFPAITEAQRALFRNLCCKWLLIFCQAEAVGTYAALLGNKYKRAVIWDKIDSAPQFTGDRPAMGYESIVCAWCHPGRCSWNAGGKRGVYRHLIRDREARVHPTQKPLALLAELLRDFTNHGDRVLDPFAGSFTTAVACVQLGRRFVGCELEERYWQAGCRRVEAAYAQLALFSPPVPPQAPTQARLFS